jgi:phage/plasmid-like protein (TIGR03299 family)
MPADITLRNDGTAEAMYARTGAWHGLGTVLADAPDSASAITAAGLDWEVTHSPLYRKFDGKFRKVPGRYLTAREDTGAELGIVGKRYHILQNRDAFAWCDSLVGTGEVRYEAAGSLKGGRMVWMLARLEGAEDVIADGDTLRRYLLLHNSHDGGGSVVITPTSVRVVCVNTLLLADPLAGNDGDTTSANTRKHTLRISHTASMSIRLDEARKVLGIMNGRFAAYAESARELAAARFNEQDFARFLDKVVPLPPMGRVTAYRTEARERITDLYYNAATQAPVRGTAWAAANAVTEFIDHEYAGVRAAGQKGEERRLYAVWWGSPAAMKAQAYRYAARIAGVDLSRADSYDMAGKADLAGVA